MKKNIYRFFNIFLLAFISSLTFLPVKAENNKDILSPVNTVILLGDKPDNQERQAASLLNIHLNKIYGTDSAFKIVKQNLLTKGKFILAIGKTKINIPKGIEDLPPFSFSIQRENDTINIIGTTSTGTLIGTGYFLDQFCGVRFYIPGDLFTSMPNNNKVELDKTISITEIPSTKCVLATGFKNLQEKWWATLNGLIRKNWESHQHSMGDRFYNDTIFRLFPEIFPLKEGQRYFPVSRADQNWQPDFAEPKLVDAAVYVAINYFKKNPGVEYISYSVQDSKNYPQEGKMGNLLKQYPNTKSGKVRGYTDAYISFLNKLAERLETELPANGITAKKSIAFIVYGKVYNIPKIKLDPGILPIKVFHLAETLMDSVFNEKGPDSTAYSRLKEWSKVTSRIGNHDWAQGKGIIYPRIYTNLISRFVRTVKKDRMTFEYAHIEAYPNWSLDGIKYYLMSKIYWNPDINTDSLLAQFCSDMFGPAKTKMNNYFTTLEVLNTSMNNNPKRNRRIGGYLTQLALDPKELQLVHQARQYINEAYSIAQTKEQKERIDFFSKGFKMSEDLFDLYNSNTANVDKADELKNYIKTTISGNQMMLNEATDKNFEQKMDVLIDQIVKLKKLNSKTQN